MKKKKHIFFGKSIQMKFETPFITTDKEYFENKFFDNLFF